MYGVGDLSVETLCLLTDAICSCIVELHSFDWRQGERLKDLTTNGTFSPLKTPSLKTKINVTYATKHIRIVFSTSVNCL